MLVNNAGFTRDRMVVSATEDEWDAVVRVHLKGHFAPTRARERLLAGGVEGGPSRVDARIVNTSSGAGLLGSVGQAAYSAAKAGIAALTLVEAAELARYGVTANALAPSARTRMTEDVFADHDGQARRRASTPWTRRTCRRWWPGSASAESADVTGRVFEVEGGRLSVADGWHHGPAATSDDRWDPAELGPVVRDAARRAAGPRPGVRRDLTPAPAGPTPGRR